MTVEERVQKILSAYGVCSRREAERLMTAGEVLVNGTPAALGDRADPERDRITVRGVLLRAKAPEHCYVMLHKPRGYVTTLSDEKGRANVAELVADCGVRVHPVGRLDLNSEGLLLLTNDGALTQSLTHPSHQMEKEYHVRVNGDVKAAVPCLRQDMTVDGVLFHGARVQVLQETDRGGVLSMVICEGKNRQIRRMCAYAGLTVLRLKRVREGAVRLGKLPVGQWRYLTGKEISALRGK